MKKSELRELIREQVRNLIKEASVSQEAYIIHTITQCGQDAAQNFIDDNKLDGKKLAAYVKQHSNSKEKYDVRDLIANTGKGAIKGFRERFLKLFKESVIKEDILNAPGQKQWDSKFKINYDDLPANLDLRTASLNKLFQGIPYQHVAYPTLSDDGNFLFKNAQDLAKAKLALGMNEAVVTEANELSSYKIGDEVKFSNGEVWKVAKPGVKGDKIFLAPFNAIAKKGHISLPIEFTADELTNTVTESINEAASDISYINKARAKSSLEQIKKGKRSDGMGKFDAKVYAIKGTQEIELTDPSDLAKYSVGYKYGLKNESVLKEAFASPILRNLLTRELNPNHRNTTTIAGAFQKMAKIALDKVPDSAVTKMNPMEAYRKSRNPDVVVFYISEKGGTNPYSKEDIYSKIEPNSLLAIASGDKKFYDIDFNYKTWKNDKPTLIRKNLPGEKGSFSHGGDSIGIRKQSYSLGGHGAPTTGLNTVKRIADVADVAYVIDLAAVRAQYGLKNESVVNEADMTRMYDGFKVLNDKTKKMTKFRYVKGRKNTDVENEAIAKLMKATGLTRPNFGVHGFVRKGEWDTDKTEIFKESVLKESKDVKSEVISRLADFFRVSPYALSKFNFDGTDDIKELTKALNSTSDQGTKLYYDTAIKAAKRDLGIQESVLKEALIGPFAISTSTPTDELQAMYQGALDGYSNYKTGMKFKKSEYKLAYQTIEKLLKKKGVAITEASITEAKEYSFTFDYNTDPDDIEYIENLLKKARVNAYAEQGTFDDEMVVIAGDAIELRKAKKAIEADGFQINEADDPEAGEAAPYGSGYAEVNEDAGMVVDVAMGVAVGLMGLWALVQSAPLVGRVFGDAAEYLADKSAKKAKLALKDKRKETIAPIIAKFKNDKQLADMYQALTPYSAAAKLGSSQAGLKAQQGRVNQLTKIGNYIKSKLTPEELVYFRDISAMLRDGDLK